MDGNQKPDDQSAVPMPLEPGATISPGSVQLSPPVAATPQPTIQPPVSPQLDQTPNSVVPTPASPPENTPQPATTQPSQPVETSAPLFEQTEDTIDYARDYDVAPVGGSVAWTASEFIAHQKSSGWYLRLFGSAAVIASLVWLFTKDIFSSFVILIALGVLAMYASRPPRELQYVADEHGLIIGDKQYAYSAFRSFAIIPEGAFSSIELIPHKRFSPAITIYYDPADEVAIAETLSRHLPLEPRKRDAIDQLMHHIRF